MDALSMAIFAGVAISIIVTGSTFALKQGYKSNQKANWKKSHQSALEYEKEKTIW